MESKAVKGKKSAPVHVVMDAYLEIVKRIHEGCPELRAHYGVRNKAVAECHRFNRWRRSMLLQVPRLAEIIVSVEEGDVVWRSRIRGPNTLPLWEMLGVLPPAPVPLDLDAYRARMQLEMEMDRQGEEVRAAGSSFEAREEEGSEVAAMIRELYPPVKSIKDLFSNPPAAESPEEPPNVKEPLWQDEPSPSSGRASQLDHGLPESDPKEDACQKEYWPLWTRCPLGDG